MMKQSLDSLVEMFASNVVAQNRTVMAGDARTGNKHAKKYLAAWQALCELGDPGWEALAALLKHQNPEVRGAAACFLLRYKTKEATAVLKEVARTRGLVGFQASECLKRWQEGTWQLDKFAVRGEGETAGRPRRKRVPMSGDVRAILLRLPREVLTLDIVDSDRFQERYDAVNGLYPGTIGVSQGSVEWIPQQEPPGEEETMAWWWLVRPDLGAAIAGEADNGLAAAIANYILDSTMVDT